jgi:hypothetical protein
VGEVILPALGAVKDGVKFMSIRTSDFLRRIPVQVSLNCHVVGYACPQPDLGDMLTAKAAVIKRAGAKTPLPHVGKLGEFNQFVKSWLKKNLTPLRPDADTSVDTWLDKTSYPLHRRNELKRKWDAVNSIHEPTRGHKLKRKKYFILKCFIKDETYPSFKHARGINSRSDEFKCAVGPIFKLIEQELFALKWFIKHVPVKNRPQWIVEALSGKGSRYASTDHTTFEASFVAEVMEACEFELYDYMTQALPEHDEFMELLREALLGVNHLVYKYFDVEIPSTRMSGEMNTSLGNGFTNLMLILFLYHKYGKPEPGAFVEGDDGLIAADWFPSKQDFTDLGFTVKMEVHESLSEASFCGLIFDPQDLVNVTDPLEVLATFGWTSNRYARSNDRTTLRLLRCKALSLAHQYPGCPILQSLSAYVLRCTKSFDVEKFVMHTHAYKNEWLRNEMLRCVDDNVPHRPVPSNTRLLVERKFGITIGVQLKWEAYFDGLDHIQTLVLPEFELLAPSDWSTYWSLYVQGRRRLDPTLEYPTGLPQTMSENLISLSRPEA